MSIFRRGLKIFLLALAFGAIGATLTVAADPPKHYWVGWFSWLLYYGSINWAVIFSTRRARPCGWLGRI